MDGVLVVDKPAGPTSHDVVVRVRRALGERRIGHTGTLDPLATGVLPLVVGRATRLAQLLTATPKTYDAVIRLGRETDTYDVTGTEVRDWRPRRSAAEITREELERALERFRGTFWQQPPPFSAKKVGGRRAYSLARRRRPVVLSPVPVTVEALDLVGYDPPDRVRVRLVSSAGFYARAFAHDLGAVLGCGGCLEALRREKSGGFGLDIAVPLDVVEQEGPAAAARLVPLGALLPDLPGVVLTERGVARARHGHAVTPTEFAPSLAASSAVDRRVAPRVRLLDRHGRLVAVAEVGPGGVLHPRIVVG
jgi:tRNA pseudouridine55 synthase